MSKLFCRFARNESGASAIEYGLIAGLIALAIVGAAASVGSGIGNAFNKVDTEVSGNM